MNRFISDTRRPDPALVDRIEQETALIDITDPRTLRRLVTGLLYAFDISPGVELPFLLGHGECECNEEALTAWVTDQVEYADWVEPGMLFNDLAYQLQRTLKSWENAA